MTDYCRHLLTKLGVFTAHPSAFAIVIAYVGVWLLATPAAFDWHVGATIATWFMTLIIQRAEHRDTQAIHAKLDELLKVDANARTELSLLDKEEPEAIEAYRSNEHQGPG